MTTLEGPAGQSPYRVPRSPVDDYYIKGTPLPASQIGTGIVVSVDGDTLTVLVGDEELDGVLFQGDPPEDGESVEVETRGDLTLVPVSNDTFRIGLEDDAEHIVSDEDPGLPPPQVINVGGSMKDLDAWQMYGTDLLGWTTEVTASGIRVHQNPTTTWDTIDPATTWDTLAATPAITWDTMRVDDNAATLWSTLPFEVEPGDQLEVTFTLAELVPSTTAQLVLLYSPIEDSTPLPTDDVAILDYPPLVLVEASTTLTTTVTVPDTITTSTGDNPPRTAKIGILLTGDGDSDLLIGSASLTQLSTGWPLGSLWMDPDAESGGLITAASATVATGGGVPLPYGTAFTFDKVTAIKKVVVQAPPYTGGIVLVYAGGAIQTYTANGGFRLRLVSMSGLLASTEVRFVEPNVPTTSPFHLSGILPIGPGELDEVTLEYTYTEATSTPSAVWTPTIQAVFLPGGVMAGGPDMDPSIRWWDGDSWRPQTLTPAAMDLTIDGTVPPVDRTATTTTISVPTTVQVGQSVTLTATVTAGATGSVTFYRGPFPADRGTALGSAELDDDTATKTWTPSEAGASYFTAIYTGDLTYEPSTSPTSPKVTAHGYVTTTTTIAQGYLQAYPEGGGQIAGTAVRQGYASSADGNRKSLIRFSNAAIPADASVTSVRLHCANWPNWAQDTGGGTLVVGWHEQPTKPPNWPSTMVHTNKSRHTVGVGEWWVDLSSWARTVVTRSDFEGLTIGPGASTSPLYRGSSATPGVFTLEITYQRYQ